MFALKLITWIRTHLVTFLEELLRLEGVHRALEKRVRGALEIGSSAQGGEEGVAATKGVVMASKV